MANRRCLFAGQQISAPFNDSILIIMFSKWANYKLHKYTIRNGACYMIIIMILYIPRNTQ